ncbi:MAG: hypothetical protein ABEI98_10905 [Halorhabdus sp.]
MNLSQIVFRFLLVIMTFLALTSGVFFLFQKPGTGGYVISVVTLLIQLGFIAVLVVAIRRDWQLFEAFEDEL